MLTIPPDDGVSFLELSAQFAIAETEPGQLQALHLQVLPLVPVGRASLRQEFRLH